MPDKLTDQEAIAEIRKGLALLYREGDVIEMRVPRKHDVEFSATISGFFNDLDKLAWAINEINKQKSTVYLTMNPVKPDWMAVNNKVYVGSRAMRDEIAQDGLSYEPRMKKVITWKDSKTHWSMRMTEDEDILERRWIMIDIDAGQPANTNSSADEHADTLAMAKAVSAYLTAHGFPGVGVTNSGNGHHVYVRVDLRNDAESAILVRRFLLALAQRFDGTHGNASVDTSTFNAARITKATGSFVYKGPDSHLRPCRRSAVLEMPSRKFATLEQITEIAAECKSTTLLGDYEKDGVILDNAQLTERLHEVQEFLEYYGLDYGHVKQTAEDLVLPCDCPNKDEHTMDGGEMESVVMISLGGRLSYCCQHAHCTELRSWRGLERFLQDETTDIFVGGYDLTIDGRVIAGRGACKPSIVPEGNVGEGERAIKLLRELPDTVTVQDARLAADAAGISHRTLQRAYKEAGRLFTRTKETDYLIRMQPY